MVRKWLTWGNLALVGLCVLLLLFSAYHYFMTPSDYPLPDITSKKNNLPKGAFARTTEEYQAIGPPAFDLSFSPISVQLPDLRRFLNYYGKNSRPDANQESPVMFFSFNNNKTTALARPGEKLYVLYDKQQSPPQYVFSENNGETPLWIEVTPYGNQASVKVTMKSDKGEMIREPKSYADFTLPEKEFIRFGGSSWDVGKHRVDGTLLARQKAKWYGIDKFIEDHGGEEYKDWASKQRIDFGEGTESYSIYAAMGDCFVWKDDRWVPSKEVEDSINYPMMCVKKADERIMNFELWDIGGKGKLVLNLVKGNEAWTPQTLEQGFKFIGARTRSQFIFEIANERMMLSPHDWLILIDGTWRKLETPEEIDDYVERRLVGPLFVFDSLDRKDEKQVILGTFYNSARTEKAEVELPLQQTSPNQKGNAEKKGDKNKKRAPPPPSSADGRPPLITPNTPRSLLPAPRGPEKGGAYGSHAKREMEEEDDDDDDDDDDID